MILDVRRRDAAVVEDSRPLEAHGVVDPEVGPRALHVLRARRGDPLLEEVAERRAQKLGAGGVERDALARRGVRARRERA